jgi:hypothetical protein
MTSRLPLGSWRNLVKRATPASMLAVTSEGPDVFAHELANPDGWYPPPMTLWTHEGI